MFWSAKPLVACRRLVTAQTTLTTRRNCDASRESYKKPLRHWERDREHCDASNHRVNPCVSPTLWLCPTPRGPSLHVSFRITLRCVRWMVLIYISDITDMIYIYIISRVGTPQIQKLRSHLLRMHSYLAIKCCKPGAQGHYHQALSASPNARFFAFLTFTFPI